MKPGDRVKHDTYGYGEVIRQVVNGFAEVNFGNTRRFVEKNSLTIHRKPSKSKQNLDAVTQAHRHQLQKTVRQLLFEDFNFDTADFLYQKECSSWWLKKEYEEDANSARRKQASQRNLREEILHLLYEDFDFQTANSLFTEKCTGWWSKAEYDQEFLSAKQKQASQQAQERIYLEQQAEIKSLLEDEKFIDADRLYEQWKCHEWWSKAAYDAQKLQCRFVQDFIQTYIDGSLADLDKVFNHRPEAIAAEITVDDYVRLKTPKLMSHLQAIGMNLDEEQHLANARPEHRLLIRARAGSGKTRTLCARAALAVRDENLKPNHVMILAFNKAAALEVKDRVQIMGGIADFNNARTFHSLAYQLVKPNKKLLFDAGGHASLREQSRFIQRMMQRILNPAFKEAMVEFFRKELEQVEDIGRDLPPREYLNFRRALELVTINGERVKSNGEKFIADFFFEYGIEYRYERAWEWKTDFLEGGTYKPDFSILANGKDYILEHWAIDPEDPHANLPDYWDVSAPQYREQIHAKRAFWLEKNKPLLETHTGLMNEGRKSFESRLKHILESAGIRCKKLPKDEIIRRVFENDFAISKVAGMFLQFIQRAKKRGWSPEDVAKRMFEKADREPRARLFQKLALRAFREYELMLEEQQAMDFDDLMLQAVDEVSAKGTAVNIHLGQGNMMPLSDLKWILIDEYQDFSELYFRLLEAILKSNPDVRLVAVGDDWQAINAFAGAELRFFEEFSDYFPNGETVGVTTNYRSDRALVAAGNLLMVGRGSPAKISRDTFGHIGLKYLDQVWIEFRQGASTSQDRESDELYLPTREDGDRPTEADIRQARALKLCTQIILEEPTQKTILLARAGRVYGLELLEFRRRLLEVISKLDTKNRQTLEKNISVMTAHASKGQEADRVIILDATRTQFPKVHPDNLLFELFGVTPSDVLEEERRLFYVAITRAEHSLYLLTEKGEESPYLNLINEQYNSLHSSNNEVDTTTTEHQVLGELATKIKARLHTFDLMEIGTSLSGNQDINPWDLVRENISRGRHELVQSLQDANIPVPLTEYYLLGVEEEIFAEMAWPEASPPVAILSEQQMTHLEDWTSRGWKIPGSDLTSEKIISGLKHYLLAKDR